MSIVPLAMLAPEVDTLDEVVFANLHVWPVLFAVPVCVLAFLWAARQRKQALARLGNPALVQRLVGSVHPGNRLMAAILVVAAVACLGVALLRLQYGGTAKVVPASGLDVVLAVDYSKSMLAQDVYPSRSERLEAELSRFLDDADQRGDRVGVVVFAGAARGFPVCRDARVLKLYLDKADPRSENPGGTAIGKALALSLTFLVDARRGVDEELGEDDDPAADAKEDAPPDDVPPAENDQAIVLLTDGEDNASRPLEVAKEAARLGVRVYTVGIGSASGEPVQKFDEEGNPDGFVTDESGEYEMTRLDESMLKEISEATGGRYVKVDPDQFSLDEVRSLLEELSRSQREDTVDIKREEGFHFLVIPALLLLTIALALPDRRRRAA
jgi:Ca-activated chloride channel family protein